jgi:uncharacterized protein YgiM (DUF1202 family)
VTFVTVVIDVTEALVPITALARQVVGRIAAVALAAAVLVGFVALPATAAPSVQVTATTNVNVRAEPSTTARVVGGLYRGQTVTELSRIHGWSKIRFGGSSAWVASRYLGRGADLPPPSRVEAGVVKVTTTALNLRNGPGLTYKVIRVLAEGTRVTTTGKTARGFAEVLHGRSRGWAAIQYLASSRTGLPAVIGTRVATADLDIRTSSGSDARTVAEVKKGTRLSVTGATQNGRAQIVFRKAVRWVTAKYLANPTVARPAPPKLPRITGTRYATTTLDVRSTYADRYTLIAEVPRGTALKITGALRNGRMQIIYANAARWVTAKYLSKTRPSGIPTSWRTTERGLQPNAVRVHRAARAKFPSITTYYGVRKDITPDHPAGRALDVMIPRYKTTSGRNLGFSVANWARANAGPLRIKYVIWDQKIWNIQRNSEGWRHMASRGSDTANHKDHVHITVYDG